MTTWPGSLPQEPLQDGLASNPISTVLRTPFPKGNPKRRRRWSTERRLVPIELVLTKAQVDTLETFYTSTVKAVLPFDWEDPVSDATISYVFDTRPTYSFITGGDPADRHWRTRFVLEVQ